MKRVLKLFKWLTLLICVISIFSFTNNTSKNQLIKLNNIHISTEDFIDKDGLISYMQEKNILFDNINKNLFDLIKLEEVLEDHPFVKNTEVYINQLGDLTINVENRSPLIRVITELDNYYLDCDMKKMPISLNHTERVLVVTGDVEQINYNDFLSFITIIKNNDFWNSQITQIHFTEDNEMILIPRVGDHKVYFGKLDFMHEKLTNLYEFYLKIMPVKGWQTYSQISLKFNNQIVCKKK